MRPKPTFHPCQARVLCAEKNLPLNPLVDYGAARILREARKWVADLRG